MRVVSWNIRFGIEAELAATEIAATPELRDPDVLLLQEMDEAGTALIADALGARYAYSSTEPHAQTGRHFGNAIVTRWPLREPTELPLPHVAPVTGHPRSATRAVVAIDGLDIPCYSVHTEIPALRLARRIEQFAAVAEDVRRRAMSRVIVAGDFNTVTGRGIRALAKAMATAGLDRVPSTSLPSYRGRGRELMLDHVFQSGFRVLDGGVVEGLGASDHDPLWVEFSPIDSA